ncbi:SDR family NAD(P)-dependent oxidoreductase [Variovorax sp. OV329]|uniref:SDR family NAD(P)-dependent oxidoreductase n=1 Tax=Variovorax sp. OV329 TaxID=1882825 RepID=UPI0008DF56AB|nr:SDR family oxidoreductase [Variovorax sp. OV329]SFL92960.1 NAD(P)-dependent dehydrogenase, short-chain alcohol dehydrogenase family [Variovorax sp. OV329]
METSRSNERHALVTGSSSGIGLALARQLIEAGWQVTGLDLAAGAFEHPRLATVQVDLCDAAATDHALSSLAPLHAFVHAAGILRVGTLAELDPEDGRRMWTLHVDAATRIARQVLPAMAKAGEGRVVLIGSRVADGIAGRSQYAASKAALRALARSWAAEVVARGVTVNMVSPAATETPMLKDPARSGTAPKLPPMGRLIRPEEVASMVSYLLSPAAEAITGQDIRICGGASLVP